jgi:GT2 family glycosyltransferase
MQQNKPKVSIIIINYNSSDLVINCINSVKNNIKSLPYEIIVVDNCSLPNEVNRIKEKIPEINLVFNKSNEGFAKANNLGVNCSKGDYILFLNPDTLVIEDFLTPIIDYILSNKEAGICGPKLIYENGAYQNSTGIRPGYLYEAAEAFMFINILRYFYNKRLSGRAIKGIPLEVSWLSAACFIMSREVFNTAGGFNSEFFLNYEDIDICGRVRKKGFKNYYFHYLSCIHLDQQSQSRNYESFVYNRYEGRVVYAKNNYYPLKRKIIGLFHISGIFLRLLVTGLFYSGKEKNDRLNGYKKALKLYLS